MEELTGRSPAYLEVTNFDFQKIMGLNIDGKYSETDRCPVRNILDRFGDKWSMLILLVLDESGVLRFNEIHKSLGNISQKVLSSTLKKLEADGLLTREVFPEIPPRVEYQLSERGHSLMPHLRNLLEWGKENFEGIASDRQVYQQQS